MQSTCYPSRTSKCKMQSWSWRTCVSQHHRRTLVHDPRTGNGQAVLRSIGTDLWTEAPEHAVATTGPIRSNISHLRKVGRIKIDPALQARSSECSDDQLLLEVHHEATHRDHAARPTARHDLTGVPQQRALAHVREHDVEAACCGIPGVQRGDVASLAGVLSGCHLPFLLEIPEKVVEVPVAVPLGRQSDLNPALQAVRTGVGDRRI
mmetsp:Transcript_43979/g.111333  ORF Transcript_43979/g.111333 Transcript_43979/m.111333 type:complete len:207 (-) Transcript_43979:114-734(-)